MINWIKDNLNSVFLSLFTGILVYYYTTWRSLVKKRKEEVEHFTKQIKATITELQSSQRGAEDRPFVLDQLAQLLELDVFKAYRSEFKALTDLKVDMAAFNGGGEVQGGAKDIKARRVNEAIKLLENIIRKASEG